MSSHRERINPNTEGQKTESERNACVHVGTGLDSKFVEFVHDLKKAARPVRLGSFAREASDSAQGFPITPERPERLSSGRRGRSVVRCCSSSGANLSPARR